MRTHLHTARIVVRMNNSRRLELQVTTSGVNFRYKPRLHSPAENLDFAEANVQVVAIAITEPHKGVVVAEFLRL